MIGQSLQFTGSVLEQYLKNRFALTESKVTLNNVIEADGTVPLENKNKIVLSLINIEKETLKPFYVRNQKLTNNSFADVNPYERYNLDLLVSSSFDDYKESLKFLNATILFFQSHTCLDATTFSGIPQGLNKLEFEIEKINYHQMHSLWTAMGAKYQPSVIFKIRLITVQANEADGFISGVTNYAAVAGV